MSAETDMPIGEMHPSPINVPTTEITCAIQFQRKEEKAEAEICTELIEDFPADQPLPETLANHSEANKGPVDIPQEPVENTTANSSIPIESIQNILLPQPEAKPVEAVNQPQLEKEPVNQLELEKEPVNQSELEKEPVNQPEIEKEPVNQSEFEKEPVNQPELEKQTVNQPELEKEPFIQSELEKEPVKVDHSETIPDQIKDIVTSPLIEDTTEIVQEAIKTYETKPEPVAIQGESQSINNIDSNKENPVEIKEPEKTIEQPIESETNMAANENGVPTDEEEEKEPIPIPITFEYKEGQTMIHPPQKSQEVAQDAPLLKKPVQKTESEEEEESDDDEPVIITKRSGIKLLGDNKQAEPLAPVVVQPIQEAGVPSVEEIKPKVVEENIQNVEYNDAGIPRPIKTQTTAKPLEPEPQAEPPVSTPVPVKLQSSVPEQVTAPAPEPVQQLKVEVEQPKLVEPVVPKPAESIQLAPKPEPVQQIQGPVVQQPVKQPSPAPPIAVVPKPVPTQPQVQQVYEQQPPAQPPMEVNTENIQTVPPVISPGGLAHPTRVVVAPPIVEQPGEWRADQGVTMPVGPSSKTVFQPSQLEKIWPDGEAPEDKGPLQRGPLIKPQSWVPEHHRPLMSPPVGQPAYSPSHMNTTERYNPDQELQRGPMSAGERYKTEQENSWILQDSVTTNQRRPGAPWARHMGGKRKGAGVWPPSQDQEPPGLQPTMVAGKQEYQQQQFDDVVSKRPAHAYPISQNQPLSLCQPMRQCQGLPIDQIQPMEITHSQQMLMNHNQPMTITQSQLMSQRQAMTQGQPVSQGNVQPMDQSRQMFQRQSMNQAQDKPMNQARWQPINQTQGQPVTYISHDQMVRNQSNDLTQQRQGIVHEPAIYTEPTKRSPDRRVINHQLYEQEKDPYAYNQASINEQEKQYHIEQDRLMQMDFQRQAPLQIESVGAPNTPSSSMEMDPRTRYIKATALAKPVQRAYVDQSGYSHVVQPANLQRQWPPPKEDVKFEASGETAPCNFDGAMDKSAFRSLDRHSQSPQQLVHETASYAYYPQQADPYSQQAMRVQQRWSKSPQPQFYDSSDPYVAHLVHEPVPAEHQAHAIQRPMPISPRPPHFGQSLTSHTKPMQSHDQSSLPDKSHHLQQHHGLVAEMPEMCFYMPPQAQGQNYFQPVVPNQENSYQREKFV